MLDQPDRRTWPSDGSSIGCFEPAKRTSDIRRKAHGDRHLTRNVALRPQRDPAKSSRWSGGGRSSESSENSDPKNANSLRLKNYSILSAKRASNSWHLPDHYFHCFHCCSPLISARAASIWSLGGRLPFA